MTLGAILISNLPEFVLAVTWSAVCFWIGRRYERYGLKGFAFWRRYAA